jgi:hypothetical protein
VRCFKVVEAVADVVVVAGVVADVGRAGWAADRPPVLVAIAFVPIAGTRSRMQWECPVTRRCVPSAVRRWRARRRPFEIPRFPATPLRVTSARHSEQSEESRRRDSVFSKRFLASLPRNVIVVSCSLNGARGAVALLGMTGWWGIEIPRYARNDGLVGMMGWGELRFLATLGMTVWWE